MPDDPPAFPGWHLWPSKGDTRDRSRWWATRTGPNRRMPDGLPDEALGEWAMTVDADDEDQLWVVLRRQEALTRPPRPAGPG